MIHVVQIIQSLSFGGAERTIVDLINHSDPRRFRYTVIVFFPRTDLAVEITRPGVPVVLVTKRGKLSLALVGDLVKKLAELKPDIVHTHIFAADVWGKIAAHRLGIPVVTTEHNVNETESVLRSFVKARFLSYTNQYVACSERVKHYIVDKYKLTQPMAVIRPGIALERFASVEAGGSRNTVKFLTVGRLVPQKGHDVALRALAKLKHLSWEYIIVGDGPLQNSLKKLAKKLSIFDRVKFYSGRPDVAKFLADSDVVLVPSRWEGLGIVAMDGMAAGKLVVASRVDGLPEVITNGKTGLLFPVGNSQALATSLAWCLSEPGAVAPMAKAGREYALAHFGAEAMARAYEKIYEKLVTK